MKNVHKTTLKFNMHIHVYYSKKIYDGYIQNFTFYAFTWK